MAAGVGAYVDLQGLPAAGRGAELGQAGLAGPEPVSSVREGCRPGSAPAAALIQSPFLPVGRPW